MFFNLAGGDPQALMTTLAPTLAAISAGSVFMGANTYIGNAPNFMVKAIAEDRGIKHAQLLRLHALVAAPILVPLFVRDDLHLVPLSGAHRRSRSSVLRTLP